MKKTAASRTLAVLQIISGSVLFSAAVGFFLSPVEIVGGGVSGIAIILSGISGISSGLLFLFLNIPVLVAGLIFFGPVFMLSTVTATVLSSLLTLGIDGIVALLGPPSSDILLCALFGGGALGAGVGLIFRGGASTGGVDILVKIINKKRPALKPGVIFLIGDGAVVALNALFTRSIEKALYSMVTVLVFSVAFDRVLRMGRRRISVLVLSGRCSVIEKKLAGEFHIRPFVIDGSMEGRDFTALLFTSARSDFRKMSSLILDTDPDAFFSSIPSDNTP